MHTYACKQACTHGWCYATHGVEGGGVGMMAFFEVSHMVDAMPTMIAFLHTWLMLDNSWSGPETQQCLTLETQTKEKVNAEKSGHSRCAKAQIPCFYHWFLSNIAKFLGEKLYSSAFCEIYSLSVISCLGHIWRVFLNRSVMIGSGVPSLSRSFLIFFLICCAYQQQKCLAHQLGLWHM